MPNRDTILNELERSVREAFRDRSPLRIASMPDFPLAFNVKLPPEASSSNGNILFRFRDFALHGAASARVDRDRSAVNADSVAAVVEWDELTLEGHYDLLVKPTPVVELDTGGTMFEKPAPDALPAGAAAVAPFDPAQQSAMLDQARQERQRLLDDPNGAQLISTYNEHNETYNTVFVTSAAARAAWAAEGATKAMALHTHTALQDSNRGKVAVNPPASEATFGPRNQTYNQNAFNQQLQIAVNTIATDPNFNPFDPNAKLDPNSRYTKAALAAITFGNAVGQTGNSKSSHNPLTGDGVHQAVQHGHPPQSATIDELGNIVAQGAQPGGAAAATARARNWRVLDEEDRTLVRRSLYAVAVERAERGESRASPIWSGACRAALSGASLRLVSRRDGEADIAETSVDLPAFEIELDDSGWSGEAGKIARERLAEAFFVASLLRERIADALSAPAKAARGGAA